MGAQIGPYELLVEVGRGGIGTVDIALQRGASGFERLVVIKRLHRHLVGDPEFVKMSRDEAHLASKVRHANAIAVTDVVEQEDELALVMDYVEGVTLSALLASGRLPPPIAARIMHDALVGLHAAHEARDLRGETLAIVHRDVSPQNILIGVDGVARVIDFGVAKADTRQSKTDTGHVKGKLLYMSPEQVESNPLDRRCDVFAASVVLFEALTGKRLFQADNDGAVIRNIIYGTIAEARSVVPDLDPAFDEILKVGLARDPKDRIPTAEALAVKLDSAVELASPREVAAVVLERCGARLKATRRSLAAALGADAVSSKEPSRLEALLKTDITPVDQLPVSLREPTAAPVLPAAATASVTDAPSARKPIQIAALAFLVTVIVIGTVILSSVLLRPSDTAKIPAAQASPPAALEPSPVSPQASSQPTPVTTSSIAAPAVSATVAATAEAVAPALKAATRPKKGSSSTPPSTSVAAPAGSELERNPYGRAGR